MTSSNKDTAVKFEPRFLGLVKTGSYDALKYENSYDQNIKMSRGRDTGKKKKNPQVKGTPRDSSDIENAKNEMLKADAKLERFTTIYQG